MKANRTHNKKLILILTMIVLCGLVAPPVTNGQEDKPELNKKKQTTLGLYVTASEAYAKWQADPEKVAIIDIRTLEEYIFVGHPEMAWCIPFAIQTHEWNAEIKYYNMKPDPTFVSRIKENFSIDHTMLLMCRSGGRSAMAVNMLAKAGFTNVYNVTEGMEGDMVKDPQNLFCGKRMKNGWKNSLIPWTYSIDPKQVVLTDTKQIGK